MKVDGRKIAKDLSRKIKHQVNLLIKKRIYPHLAIILVGQNPASLSYIKQKQKTAVKLGIKTSLYKIEKTDSQKRLISVAKKLNKDKKVHGVIIQRPVSLNINKDNLNRLVSEKKDVDGFHPKSRFDPPVALAVMEILKWIYNKKIKKSKLKNQKLFTDWLKKQNILIIGRGETGGKPIAKYFSQYKINFLIAHSKTKNLERLLQKNNIIISSVGKKLNNDYLELAHQGIDNNNVRHNINKYIKIFISIGIHKEKNRLKADFNLKTIDKYYDFFTPVPGGVGPVNVISLFSNLISAC